jgi:hypothetical protein
MLFINNLWYHSNIMIAYYNQQAKRGFAKEASVYFPYLDSIIFHTIHYATLPFRHSAIPPFHHSAIPPFRHSAIPPFRHSVIPPLRHSAIPPFHHLAIPPFRHSAIPPFRHSAIPPFHHSAIPPFRHSAPIHNNTMYVSQEVLRKAVMLPGGLWSNKYVPPLHAK